MAKPGPRPRPIAERFWSHVEMGDGCWLWTAARSEYGHGIAVAEDRRLVKAHRLSWTLHNGPIPPGVNVCHHCDNPPCVRPDHLFLGDQAANMGDARAKGRTAAGDRNGSRTHPERFAWKLGRDGAAAIRARYTGSRGEMTRLAREFGVTRAAVAAVLYGRSYRER